MHTETIITYNQCPCCGSSNINNAFFVQDYTVSQNTYEVWNCNQCTARFTQHIPNAQSIGVYYKSDNYISHSDTKQNFISKLYHIVRKFTLKSKQKLVTKHLKNKQANVLDIGAGTGAFANTLKQAGYNVTGLEPDDQAREVANNNYGIQLQPISQLFNLKPTTFDAITLWHVLEHVHDLHEYFEQFNLLLKQAGKLVIAVPNYTSYDAFKYKQYWAAYDVPRHLYHFSPQSIIALAQKHNFKLITQKPMWFDSYYVALLSEKYKLGYNTFVMPFITATISNLKALLNTSKCSSVIYIFEKN